MPNNHRLFLSSKGGWNTVVKSEHDVVGNWMKRELGTINPFITIRDAIHLLGTSGRTELPVVEKDRLTGVFKLKECMDKTTKGMLDWNDQVAKIITPSFAAVNIGFSMAEVVDTPLYILEEGKIAGVIDVEEILAYNKALGSELQKLKDQIKWFEHCFDTAYEGLTVVDEHGVIQLFNETYSRFVGVSKEEAIGKQAETIIDNTRLPVVLKTGVPERSQAHRLQGQNLVVHRLPIWGNNKVIGAIGMLVYEGISEIYQVIERMEQLEVEKNQANYIIDTSKAKEELVRFEDILGESPAIAETKKIARKAAQFTATVLITGESGVGKEQFARAIHDMGVPSQGNFVSVNCAAIPDTLLESELFGYSEGSFTGAKKGGKAGKFELAHQGTLFLDEIGDMPMAMQVKVLRVLQEKEIERVGEHAPIPVNFRLITATNKDLKQMVKKGKFREDLYYRLYVIPIHIPPLRDRKQDIPIIIANKMQKLAQTYKLKEKTIDRQILKLMYKHDWPGNVRELINVLERLFVLTDGVHINTKDLPKSFFSDSQVKDKESIPLIGNPHRRKEALKVALEEEKEGIENMLRQAKGNKSQAARMLGISRATLYNKLSQFQIADR